MEDNFVNKTVLCTLVDEKTVECHNVTYTESEGLLSASNALFWVYLLVYMFLVLSAGKLCCKLALQYHQQAYRDM